MKNKILFLYSAFAVLFIFGCSAGNMAGSRDGVAESPVVGSVSGSAGAGVTGGAAAGTEEDSMAVSASGGAVGNGEPGAYSEKLFEWENSTNGYKTLGADTDMEGFFQYTKQGEKIGKIVISEEREDSSFSYWNLDDEGLVYSEEKNDDEGMQATFYYVPVTKSRDGNDRFHLKKKKKLFKAENLGDYVEAYADSRYIILFDQAGKYMRYDLKLAALTEEHPFGEKAYVSLDRRSAGTDEIYAMARTKKKNSLYCQNLGTMEWKKLQDVEPEETMCAQDWDEIRGILFFVRETDDDEGGGIDDFREYYCRDIKKDTFTPVVRRGDILRVMREEGLIRKGEECLCCESMSVYCRGSLYIQCLTGTYRKKIYEPRYAVFRVGTEENSLVYEREFTEHMWDTGTYIRHVWDESGDCFGDYPWGDKNNITLRANAAECLDIRDGEALFVYEAKKGVFEYEIFNLFTGGSRRMTESEEEGSLGDVWETYLADHDPFPCVK